MTCELFAYIKNFLEANLNAVPLLIRIIISPFEVLRLIDEAGHYFFLAKYEVCTNGWHTADGHTHLHRAESGAAVHLRKSV